MKFDVEKFIEFVVDLVNEDEIFLNREVDAAYYFTHGGCYELYKIVHHYFKDVICMINKENDHCAIGYDSEIYDAYGSRKDKENFYIATKKDIQYMQDRFGLSIKQLEANKIIEDIADCRVQGKLY